MADEARAMLDQLMGGDRNAPIPKGASLGRANKKRSHHSSNATSSGSSHSNGGDNMSLPGVRKRSCYDNSICPFYTAWGVDIFELFVNTKSDLGQNELIVDDDARAEFASLDTREKERLGYEYMLYRKLQELVRSCDRTVSRNKDKLRMEIQRKGIGGSGSKDPVMNVDEDIVLRIAEFQTTIDELEKDIDDLVDQIDELEDEDEDEATDPTAVAETTTGNENENKDDVENITKNENENKNGDGSGDAMMASGSKPKNGAKLAKLHSLTTAIQNKVYATQPLNEQIETQKRSLYFFRSDTSTDKTVCEVSGNFMSSRDADERIAAHYAGKQYVGWKAVRDKYAELHKLYGPGGRGKPPPMGMGMPHHHPMQGMAHYPMGGMHPPPGAGHHGMMGGGGGGMYPPMMGGRDRDRQRGGDRSYADRERAREREKDIERDWRRGGIPRDRDRDHHRDRSHRDRDRDRDRDREHAHGTSRGYSAGTEYDRYGDHGSRRSDRDRRERRSRW